MTACHTVHTFRAKVKSTKLLFVTVYTCSHYHNCVRAYNHWHFVAKQPSSPCPVEPTQTSCRLLCTVCHSRWTIWEGSSTSQTNIMVTTRPAENQPLASRNDRHPPSSGEAHEHGWLLLRGCGL